MPKKGTKSAFLPKPLQRRTINALKILSTHIPPPLVDLPSHFRIHCGFTPASPLPLRRGTKGVGIFVITKETSFCEPTLVGVAIYKKH